MRFALSRPCRGLAVLLLCLTPLAALAEITLDNADGTTLTLDEPATRVITLAPHLAELMYLAGAGERLLATVEYSDYPGAAAELPRIGDAFRFDLERIMALRPDLIIAWHSGNPLAAQASLEELGLPVWKTEVLEPADLASLLNDMGRATDAQSTASEAARATRERLADLEAEHRDAPAIRYFYQVAERPLYTVNGEHLISQGLAICGGVNIFHDLPTLAPQVAHEAVIAADPAVLIAGQFEGAGDPLAHWREWPGMAAVANDAFVLLPADQMNRATPRMLDAVEMACTLLNGLRSAE